MQRYRINYKWLIGVFVTGLVLAVVSFFVHGWQVERNADYYLKIAEQAEADGNPFEEFQALRKYVKFRPKEEDVRIKAAHTAIKVMKNQDATIEQQSLAFMILDQTVRTTDDAKLRRALAGIVSGFRPQDAIGHVEDLLADNPNDPELNAMLARSLFQTKDYKRFLGLAFKLVGYNKQADTFDTKNSQLAESPDIFALLSQVLVEKEKKPNLARRVIDEMVLANPESAQAHLQKSVFHSTLKEYRDAKKHLDKAYALDPKDAAVLTAKGGEALGSNYPGAKLKYEKAISNYEEALSQLAPKGGVAALDDPNSAYNKSKKKYLESVSRLEKAVPNLEEAKSNYEEAKSNYEEAFSKLEAQASTVQDSSFQEVRDRLEEAKSNFGEALPDYEEAKVYFAIGLKEHEEPLFYRLMADAEHRSEQNEAALKILDEGIEKFGKYQSTELVLYKLELLFDEKDYDHIDREVRRLTQLNRPGLVPIIDFQKARVLFSKKQWVEGAKELERIRALLLERPQYQLMAGYMLGICYENQGIFDLAKQAYSTVLNDSPSHLGAIKGLERIRALRQPKQGAGFDLEKLVNEMLEVPEADQDWGEVNELIEKLIADNELPEARQKLLHAKVMIKRGKLKEATAMIRGAAKLAPDDIDIHYAAILLVASDPKQGSAASVSLLDRLEKRWGRTLRSRAQRANLLVSVKPEDVAEQLRALMNGTEDLTEVERLQLIKVIGSRFEQMGMLDDAKEYYEKAIVLEPSNLPIRMHMFDLAVRQRDDAAMQKAQSAVLEFVKSKNDPSYLLTEVKRRIMSYSRGEIDLAELADARRLLDTALLDRPEWHELYITYGQLLLLLKEDINLALKYFDNALEYGPVKSSAVGVQVKLLVKQGLYPQARERMERLNPEIRGRILGRIEAEVLIKTGDSDAGFAAAEGLAEKQPKDLGTQEWFSKIAQEKGEYEAATTSLRRALDLNPSNPDNWLRMVGLYAQQKKYQEVEDALREAHLSCDAEFLPLLTGKHFEMTSQWQMAEDLYLASYADRLDELSIDRRIADFYLFWSSKEPANTQRAAQYINRILRAANEGKATPDHPHVVWARQKAATILHLEHDYQKSLKAERLLRQSTANSSMNDTEFQLLADILVARDDPASLLQAKQLLTDLRKSGRLQTKGALQLARILSKTNQWEASQSLMLGQISKHSTDPLVWTTYIDLLIDQGEFSGAERGLKRLRKLNPKSLDWVQLSARVASEKGDQKQLKKLLTALLPKMGGSMSQAQLQTVLSVAHLATRFGDFELAGKLYEVYASRVPDDAFQLAKFLAYHGDCGRALELMKRLYPSRMDDVVQLANLMLGARREEIGEKYDEQVDRLIDAALREDPDSMTRQLARAEAFGAQEKYDKSMAAYGELLARDDLPNWARAAAMNNLGFQLGLLEQRVDEAEQMVNQAIETFGPVEDMLDTRAIVRIAQGKYDLAIEDLKLALSVSRDPVKHFHLAKACILAGDGQAATAAWKKAQTLGFKKESLPKLEKPTFEQIVEQIEAFQPQGSKL